MIAPILVYDRCPNEITIYGSNEPDDDASWVQLAHFYQSPLVPGWADKCSIVIKEYSLLEREEPIYVDIPCVANEQEYRYIKMVPHGTFFNTSYELAENTDKAIALSELEVFVKKE